MTYLRDAIASCRPQFEVQLLRDLTIPRSLYFHVSSFRVQQITHRSLLYRCLIMSVAVSSDGALVGVLPRLFGDVRLVNFESESIMP